MKKFAEMVKMSVEQIIGKSVFEIAGNVPGVRERYQHVADGGRVDNVTVHGELRSRPGEFHTWLVNYAPLMDADGKVRSICTVSLDITTQKQVETALIQSENSLPSDASQVRLLMRSIIRLRL
jgi:PAS domain S-box-containing protein